MKNKIVPLIFSWIFFFSPLPAVQDSFESDIHQLTIFKDALHEMFEEMVSLHENTSRLETKYISNIENDQIENLLFRYLILRGSLWEVIGKYRDYNTLTDDPETNMKAFVIGYYAALTLYKASGHLITINMKDDQLVDKLNESYFRSGIPKNTFEKIFNSLTNPENLEDLDIARELYSRELYLKGSPLNLLLSDSLYVPLINELEELQKFHEKHRVAILNHYVLLTPEITNLLRHSNIQKQAENLIEQSGGQYEALKAFLLTWVGDIKSPVTDNLYFTEKEKNEIKKMLSPGDIILTYSAGYMSNIFLPGTFKHGIVYVGDRQSWNEHDWASLHLSAEKRAFIQPGDDMEAATQSSKALIDFRVNFYGKSAHASADPYNGFSAVDGMELFTTGINYYREHIKPTARIHYQIEKAGDVVNVVPDKAQIWVRVRENDRESLDVVYQRVMKMAAAGALMAEVDHKIELISGIYEILPNRRGAAAIQANFEMLGPIKYTKKEIEYAKEIQRATGKPEVGMDGAIYPLKETKPAQGGSTDVGDVSQIVPVVRLSTPAAPKDAPWHSWAVVACTGMSIGHKGMIQATKALGMTMVDLFEDPQLVKEVTAEFKERKGSEKYEAMIPPGPPPVPQK